ncbi:hypothetical protein DL93DRAFT_2084164 [Clavulina sp. PMI_390]|nr:hypothetical protein DL93DRAFT_2084164 [Clavulina sp. PMI_390]
MIDGEASPRQHVTHFAPTVSVADENNSQGTSPHVEGVHDAAKDGGKTTSHKPFWSQFSVPTVVKQVAQAQFGWVAPKMNVRSMKPVVRSAVSGWISLILFIIPRTELALGNASFLILIAAVLSPPNEPFIAVLRRELNILAAVCLAWAWTCIALAFASLSRPPVTGTVSLTGIFAGRYANQFTPNAILLTFMAIGGAFFVYLRARLGPGPYVFATVFGCICIDICFTTAALFPYSYYQIGQTVVIPLAAHSAISLLCSALIFPETVNAQFTKRLVNVLTPLSKALKTQPELLKLDPFDKEFDAKAFQNLVNQAEAGLIPLRASSDLLKQDFSYGRFSGKDLKTIRDFARKLTVRCDGLAFYYRILDPTRTRFPTSQTPAPTRPGSPALSRQPSLLASPELSRRTSAMASPAVGILGEISSDLILSCAQAIDSAVNWLELTNHERFKNLRDFKWFSRSKKPVSTHPKSKTTAKDEKQANGARADKENDDVETGNSGSSLENQSDEDDKEPLSLSEAKEKLREVLERFKNEDRLKQLRPYVSDNNEMLEDYPPHRYLFQSFTYHFHLLELSDGLILFLSELEDLAESRKTARLWGPSVPWRKVFPLAFTASTESEGNTSGEGDDDPSIVEGLDLNRQESEQEQEEEGLLSPYSQLNPARSRDPDAYPPSNTIELLGSWIFKTVIGVTRGNVLFAIKIGVLTALMALPNFLASSAGWAYERKWVWSVIMCQLTSARFKGDTAVNFTFRIIATFCGGIAGLVVWYISAGDGLGNPYGLAATCLIFFPILFTFRIYYPGPPITTLITSVTAALVFGYSYKDTHDPTPGSPGFGWDVAWRRFVGVVMGVTAAFLFSFLPPSVTVRRYQRVGQSTVMIELGTIACSVISIASSQKKERQPALVKDLISIRSKIRKLKAQSANASYEFSLRGKWPASRYTAISNMQLEIAYLLSHLYTVVIRMDNVWVQAFLSRTRLLDPDFLGSLLSTITMCASSLKTGAPLPQITAAPLTDALNKNNKMIDVIAQEIDFGLPRVLTPDVLGNEQYMCFCVGVSSVYSLVRRLDRLMFAVKELVGENFHVDGVEIPLPYAHTPGGSKIR